MNKSLLKFALFISIIAATTQAIYAQITSPVFEKANIFLDQRYATGKTFAIVAKNNSDQNIYIQSIKLNGQSLDRFWITHQEIIAGGILEMEMGPTPNIK